MREYTIRTQIDLKAPTPSGHNSHWSQVRFESNSKIVYLTLEHSKPTKMTLEMATELCQVIKEAITKAGK